MSQPKATNREVAARLGVHVGRRRRGRMMRKTAAPGDHAISNQLIVRLDHALRDIGDRGELNRNALAHTLYMENMAGGKYKGQLLPRGLALRHVVLDCVDQVCKQLADEPALASHRKYLRLRADGHTCRDISNHLGLSREHVSRTIRKKALELLAEEFRTVTKNEAQR